MGRVTGETLIDRPVEAVFDFVADERNRYDPRVVGAELLTDGPLGEGTCFLVTSTAMGRTVDIVVEITEYLRPRRLATTTHLAFMDIHSTLDFEPDGDATRLRWASEVAPHGALRLLGPVFRLAARRQTRHVWAGLQHELEAGGRQRLTVR